MSPDPSCPLRPHRSNESRTRPSITLRRTSQVIPLPRVAQAALIRQISQASHMSAGAILALSSRHHLSVQLGNLGYVSERIPQTAVLSHALPPPPAPYLREVEQFDEIPP